MRYRLFGRLLFLFVSLIVIVIVSPFLHGSTLGQSIVYALIALACISTVYGLRLGKRATIGTLVLGVISVVAGEASLILEGSQLNGIAVVVAGVFYGYLISLLIRYIVHAEQVTADILYGAVCVYLLIGIVFAAIYRLIDILVPAAFAAGGNAGSLFPPSFDYTYFSFVTLTTLGYGDIYPLSTYARTFAVVEAMTGTLYVAILISRLVSLYLTHSIMDRRN